MGLSWKRGHDSESQFDSVGGGLWANGEWKQLVKVMQEPLLLVTTLYAGPTIVESRNRVSQSGSYIDY